MAEKVAVALQRRSFKAGVEFDVALRSLLYGNVRTGFEAGGFGAGLASNTYRPEKLTAYEIGSKNRFFNNSLHAEIALDAALARADRLSIDVLYEQGKDDTFPTSITNQGVIGGLVNYPRIDTPKFRDRRSIRIVLTSRTAPRSRLRSAPIS